MQAWPSWCDLFPWKISRHGLETYVTGDVSTVAFDKPRSTLGRLAILGFFFTFYLAATADAHLLVNNELDVVVSRDHVSTVVRIAAQEVLTVESRNPDLVSEAELHTLAAKHRAYVISHLHLSADGRPLAPVASTTTQPNGDFDGGMAVYTIDYALSRIPSHLTIQQDFLREIQPSDASFVVRFRQCDEADFEASQLPRGSKLDFDLHWTATATTRPAATAGTRVSVWRTARAFVAQGVWHILTGYDHLLFVTGLLLGASSLLDLIKVVFAFTLAHSLTLALSVFNVVNLDSRIVEPMISASIVLIALQNLFWPRKSSGWPRIATAFAFGLFHGLGFAGGLKDAMAELPAIALWTALISFSVGVELGHQVVVLPMFAVCALARRRSSDPQAAAVDRRLVRWGSAGIAFAGLYFLVIALRLN